MKLIILFFVLTYSLTGVSIHQYLTTKIKTNTTNENMSLEPDGTGDILLLKDVQITGTTRFLSDIDLRTTSPRFEMRDTNTNAQITFQTDDNGNLIIDSDPTGSGTSPADVIIRIEGDEKIRIENTGEVMINNSTNSGAPVPAAGVDLSVYSDTPTFQFMDKSNSEESTFVYDSNRMTLRLATDLAYTQFPQFEIQAAGVDMFTLLETSPNTGIDFQARLPQGTAAEPGISFLTDTDTGFYRDSTNNLKVSAGGAFVGRFNVNAIAMKAGGEGTPSYTFDTDTDLGLYRIGNDQLGFSIGAQRRAVMESVGLTMRSEALGSNVLFNGLRVAENDLTYGASLGVKEDGSAKTCGFITLNSGEGITARNYLWQDGSDILRYSTSTSNVCGIVGLPIGAQVSDERLKDNIRTIPYGLDEALLLNPIMYEKDGKTDIGYGAQKTESLVPEAVISGLGNDSRGKITDGTMKGMSYVKIIPVNTKAIQELHTIIETLTARLEVLEAQ